VRSIRDARDAPVVAIDREGGTQALIAHGKLANFRCTLGEVREVSDTVVISSESANAIHAQEDSIVTYMARA